MAKIYYLIDTNVFMDCPEILDRIPDEDYVIIVNHVIYELDGLHKSEDHKVRIPAKEAQNNIHNNSGREQVILIHTRAPYPPFEKPVTMDQKILSTGLRKRFSDGKVILLTSDVNMMCLADTVKLKSMSLKQFLRKNNEVYERKKKVSWKKIAGCLGLVGLGVAIGWGLKAWTDSKYLDQVRF